MYGALVSSGIGAAYMVAGKVGIAEARSAAHSINIGDSLGKTVSKTLGSMAVAGVLSFASEGAKYAKQTISKGLVDHLTRGSMNYIVENGANYATIAFFAGAKSGYFVAKGWVF